MNSQHPAPRPGFDQRGGRHLHRPWFGTSKFGALLGALCTFAVQSLAEPRSWDEYRVILWVGDSVWKRPDKVPLFLERLREMGVDTAMVHGVGADPQPWLAGRFPFYVENIVNRGLCLKWNSPVADWEKFVTDWAKIGRAESAFIRPYCLDDPQWLGWAKEQMQTAARRFGPHTPLAYNIRDELSVTISANPFDYDFAPAALAGFRDWLKVLYAPQPRRDEPPSSPAFLGTNRRDVQNAGVPTAAATVPASPTPTNAASGSENRRSFDPPNEAVALAALNTHWQTRFASWDEVRPFSTDQIKHRMASGEAQPRGQPDWQTLQRLKFDPATARREPTRWNFAPWGDFRTYMDVSLARVLGELRQAAREVDPATPVGIEGTQMPSAWGGYDLWRLAQVLDWVEPYDIGNAREILGSFMSGKPILTTVFENETNAARRRLWHLLLEGDRGCIIWWSEDCLDWDSPDYALTPKARALMPVLRELKSPLTRLFLRAERVRDPIYLHYSQPSIQVAWLLESTVDGSTWPRRFSSFEAEHNRHARVRNAWLKALQDLGFSPQFISSEQLERLRLKPEEPFTLVLPRSLALSDHEAVAIESIFSSPPATAQPTRLVLSEGVPGLFDEHGRLRATNRLERWVPVNAANTVFARRGVQHTARAFSTDLTQFSKQRLAVSPSADFWHWLADEIGSGPIRLPPSLRARVHRFRAGTATLVAVERNIEYQMSEDLRQSGGNEALEQPIELTARLSAPAPAQHIYDLRSGKDLGYGREWPFTLDPWLPALFALLPEPASAETLVRQLLEEFDRAP